MKQRTRNRIAATIQRLFYGETVMPQEFDWNITGDRANTLFLKPMFSNPNSLTDMFSIMRNVKTKSTMYYLNRPKKILQKNDNCDWTPKGSMGLTQRQMTVERIKAELEQCNDEFFDTCLENSLGNELDIFDPESSDHIRRLKAAMLVYIIAAIQEDLFRLALMGDTASSDPFYELLDGIYKDIDALVLSGQVTEVGAGSGAPLSPGDAVDILRSVHANSTPILRNVRSSDKTDWVTDSIFQNLKEYYQALGTEQANTLIIQGETAIGGTTQMLLFDGTPVRKMEELDIMLTEDFGLTNPHRVISTANGNLKFGTDMVGKSAQLRIYMDPVHKKKWYYAAAFKGGAKVAHPELITVAK